MFKLKKLVSLALVAIMLMSTFTCLGGVFSIGASAASTPTWTDPTGKTYTVGTIGTDAKTHDEAAKAYDTKYGVGTSVNTTTYANGIGGTGGWVYLAADCYEIPAAQIKNENIKDYVKNLDTSDGYVKCGDYIFTTITMDASAGLYVGTATLCTTFPVNFFDFINSTANADNLGIDGTDSDLATFAAKMNTDNAFVKSAQAYCQVSPKTTVYTSGVAGQTGLSQTQLESLAGYNFGSKAKTTTVFQTTSSTNWYVGFLLQVKSDLKDGTTGAIYAQPELYKSADNIKPNGNVNLSYKSTTAITAGKMLYAKAGATTIIGATLILDDFGCCFCVGEPANGFTATFNNADNTEFTKQEDVKEATKPTTDPIKAGYSFDKWVDKDGNAVTFPKALTANTTFYPTFTANNYTATFNANGGAFGAGAVTSKQVAYDSDITADGITAPTNGTKNLLGWSRNKDAEAGDATLGKMDNVNGVTIYAIWSEAPTFAYYFKLDGNTLYTNNTTGAVAEYTIPADKLPEGYEFDYWTLNGTKVTSWPANIAAESTFVAVLKAKNYTVTWKDGVKADQVDNVAFGSTITKPADPSKPGYTFTKWDKEIPAKMPAQNLVFTAQYAAKTYTVKLYESKNATEPFATLYPTYNAAKPGIGANADAMAKVADTEGKTFAGWYNKADDSVYSTAKNSPLGSGTYTYAGDLNLYLVMSTLPVIHTYVSDGNGGFVLAGTYNIKTKSDQSTYVASIATGNAITWDAILTEAKAKAAENKVTYTNTADVGTNLIWYTDASLATMVLYANGNVKGGSYVAKDSVNLYLGKADTASSFKIGDTTVPSTGIKEGNSISIPVATVSAAAEPGMKFVGFYVEGDKSETLINGKLSSTDYSFTLLPGVHNYVAKYEPIEYTVTIRVGNNIVATTTAGVGTTIDVSKIDGVPAIGKELTNNIGHTVSGYSTTLAGVTTDFSVPVTLTEDNINNIGYKGTSGYQIVINGTVEAIIYKATFVCTDGATFADSSTSKEFDVACGTTMDAMKKLIGTDIPTKTGYIFSMWDPTTAMPAHDQTFTAVMVKESCILTFVFTKDADGKPLDKFDVVAYYGDTTMTIVDTEYEVASYRPDGVSAGRWQNGCVFTEWAITAGEFAEDGKTVIGNMTFEAQYESFDDMLLVLYNSNIADPTVTAELGSGANRNICLTLSKKLKLTFWNDGAPVSIKEFKVNLDPESFILLFKLRINKMEINDGVSTEEIIKLVNEALGENAPENFAGDLKILSAEQAEIVKAAAEAKGYTATLPEGGNLSITKTHTISYLAACPLLLKWSFLNPLNIVDNFKLIISVLGSLIG